MSGIFICYRRLGAGYAGRLIFDHLEKEFAPVPIFMDVDKLDLSPEDFVDIIKENISTSNVFLCLIDKDWLTCESKTGKRRLDDPNDYVRLEIITALESNICVAPILLQNVEMPRDDQLPIDLHPLINKQNCKVRHEEFNSDMAMLIKSIRKQVSKSSTPPEAPLEFVDIPAGTFQMGSPPTEEGRFEDEELHKVEISAFAITKYPITFDQYDYYAEKMGRHKPDDNGWNRGKRPVINISANEALKYAAWLSEEQGQRFRLPTEAEWEYAARAGTVTAFHFGDTIDIKQANFANHNAKTVAVDHYQANKWGLYNAHGNVWEWTCSEYIKEYAGAEQKCVEKKAKFLTLRGGSWKSERRFLRSASRVNEVYYKRRNDLGFRLVRDQG